MPQSLRVLLYVTDVSFLLYWALAGLSQLGAIEIPPAWMYANYDKPDVIAWNWSFFPLDLAFSYCGLRAIAASRAGSELWRPYALVSLILTITAGGMAVGYWAILREFDPLWFGMNLSLVVWPLFYLRPFFSERPVAA